MDYNTARALLQNAHFNPFESEDSRRCWSRRAPVGADYRLIKSHIDPNSVYALVWDKALLRVWDGMSGSQPKQDRRMVASATRQRLDTRDARVRALADHLDHKVRTPTPYISFTDSPDRLEGLARLRKQRGNRGQQYLTVVDPQRRIQRGLPILHLADEMKFYDIIPPYSADYSINHYLCLWEVTPEEVVGTWEWDELTNDGQWYEHKILPALRAHQEAIRQRHRIERDGNEFDDDKDNEDDEQDENEDDNEEEEESRADKLEDNVLAAALGKIHCKCQFLTVNEGPTDNDSTLSVNKITAATDSTVKVFASED